MLGWHLRALPPPGYEATRIPKGAARRSLASTEPSSSSDLCQNIHRSVCRKKGTTVDPTGSVQPDTQGEMRALRMYEEILREHRDWSTDKAEEELVARIYTPPLRSRVESAFKWVRNTMESFILSQPESVFNAREKRQLRKRLRKVKLEIPPPLSLYADEPGLLTKSDVFYERTQDGSVRLRIGGAYLLSARSWFNIVFTIAHELAHSIDPCEIRQLQLSFPAYDHLYACFLHHGLVASRASRNECVRNDQLSEAFADWMAVQVSARALEESATQYKDSDLLNAAINSVRDLCEEEDGLELDTEFHPSAETRINQIFGTHPKIRQLLGCPAPDPSASSKDLCSFEWRTPENSY